ncbi:nodulin MtN21 /EamA-like transporter family protein [Euphorbia peplus]|nr:nodulin MtN21 /EamA-like transporter family protein [Euphorbia peplus]
MEEIEKDLVGKQTENKLKETHLVRSKPYVLCIFSCLSYATFNIISKVCLDKGMNPYVLVAYGYAFGTLSTAFLAFLFERKNESKISIAICIQIFFVGLLGVLGRIAFYAGLKCTSPTFAAAMNNLLPSVTFILAILCGMEKLNLVKLNGQAKVGGTIVAFGGATVMTLYKGIIVISGNNHHPVSSKQLLDGNLVKGSILFFLQNFGAALCYLLQASIIKKYPAPITLTTLSGLSGTLIATFIAAILNHKSKAWRLALDITLIAPIYSGIMVFGVTTYVETLVVRIRGPVFATAFRPFVTVIVAVMGFLILGEALSLGRIIGAVMIIVGLYAILWAKEYEKNIRILEP